jgi:hypothetical protein
MRSSMRLMLAATLMTGLGGVVPAGDALAQSYPRVTGSGMELHIDYGPMGQGNLVGGGRVSVSQPSGMDVNIMHFDSMFAQQPREGFVPLTIGSGESQETVWVPSTMLDMVRRARTSAQPR